MTTYTIVNENRIEIDFHGVKPDSTIRGKMKAAKIWWDPSRMIWFGPKNDVTLAVAKEICGEAISVPVKKYVRKVPPRDYALKIKIKDIIAADKAQFAVWERQLREYVNEVMGEDNATYVGDSVSKSQESVWLNCFKFVATNLSDLSAEKQEYELVFEYSLPGTVHERPDVFLLTAQKAISLEFKRKGAPQVDDNKDDVAQAIRYKEWLENHHKVTKDRSLDVKSYLVCTHNDAAPGSFRGIAILTKENFCDVIDAELEGEGECYFIDEWLASTKTEMPDMLQAIEVMYREGKIPYISDVNKKCLKTVLGYINEAKVQRKRFLILINGVPGAGKTAVGQSVVYEENKNGDANAVYLSGNGPLVEVLQYQINQAGNNNHMGENAIQGMKDFKSEYFSTATRENTKVPQQSILIFDEAQRAWDTEKLKRGFSEPEGLFDVGERIYKEKGYAVIIGLYGNGQVIYDGEEKGLVLWEDALKRHTDWCVIAADEISANLQGLGVRKIVNNDVFLPVSLRADFIDCSRWVEQAIGRVGATVENAMDELAKLQKTSMRICITRNMEKIRARMEEMEADHPEWKYGILISNFAVQNVVRKAMPGWNIGYHGKNTVWDGGYGPWFAGECKLLTKACSVYGSQGLELDCPIVLFGGGYIRKNGEWITNGGSFDRQKRKFHDPDTIVENNFRVLLTRARKEMILLIPEDRILDETYRFFVDMGMDEL
ncbi:MAG: DUF2075 domain-containing protein [Hespellia sp.]|nr:DUF2075 domain-containing protein [Hespellia sp.]